MQKVSGRWTDQEKYAFEAGLAKYGRGNWRLFLALIPTKTQLQIRQHAYAYFKKKRLRAESLLRKQNGISSETSDSESDSDASDDEDNNTSRLSGSDHDSSDSRPRKKRCQDNSDSPPTVRPSSESDGSFEHDSTPVEFRRKKKKHKKKKSGKKRRAMWTEEEHRLFLNEYKTHPRNWTYLSTIVTSKTPTQVRTHAYSVFQRRRRVGTPLPSGFENMDHSWHRRDDDDIGGVHQNDSHYITKNLKIVSRHRHGNCRSPFEFTQTPKSNRSKPRDVSLQHQRDSEDKCEQLVQKAISERAAKWTQATAMFPPQPPNASRGSGITLSDYLAGSIVY